MIIPSMVNPERSLLAARALNDMRILSNMFMVVSPTDVVINI
jgi:hypothetical protein